MADIKVSQLPEASEINDEDLLMIVQDNTNKKITKANAKFASGDEVAVQTTEPTGEDADSVKIWINPNLPTNQAKYKDGNNWEELYIKALDSMPIGSIIGFAGTNIPNGWLICDGSTLDEETYPELYDALGASGSTFTLPDYQGRVPVGYNANDTDFNAIGKTGGSKALQSHAHELQTSAGANYAGMVSTAYSGDTGWAVTSDAGTKSGGNVLGGITRTTGQGNSGNLQPYIVQYFIIKAKNTTPTMASIVNATNNSTTDGYSCDYVNNAFGGKVLWTNNSTSSFAEQQITLNSSDYNYLEIYYLVYTGSTVVKCDKMQKGTNANLSSMFIYGGNNFGGVRNVNYVDDTHLSIKDCGKVIQNNAFATGNDNSWLIPIKIIGYK